MSINLFDAHAHLEVPAYDKDRDEVIKRAKDSSIRYILTCGTNLSGSRRAKEISDAYDCVYFCAGFHPHYSKEMKDGDLDKIEEFLKDEKALCVGEIGLDFYRNLSPKDIQFKVFRLQLEFAKSKKLPVVIHSRASLYDVLRILLEERVSFGIFHCFPGEYDVAKKVLDLGFYISVPGSITYDKTGRWQRLLPKLPIDRILVETDCPYLTPHPFRGRRNEPAYVKYTAKEVAKIMKMSFEKLCESLFSNFLEFMKMAKGDGKGKS